jgi:glycosyltransferase involved in cell wall biosynthesis
MRRKVIIQWGISSFFGWGVYGLNLAIHWGNDPEIEPLCSVPLRPGSIEVDALRRRALEPFLQGSAAFQAQLAAHAGTAVAADRPVLAALGNDFALPRAAHDVLLTGRPTIGVVFFEVPQLGPEVVARAKALDLIVAGSTWNARVLAAYGVTNVRTVLQGIDPTLFHPAPAARPLGDRFLIFSGGKLERRKGQDIVLAAFRTFAARHPEALLVTAWHSPWPALARTVDESGLVAPVVFDANSRPDVRAWAAASGIDPGRVIDLGAVPNALMPPILREADVALFPNRAEGGTNLVAMECMACGVPTILSANTGHLDLIEDDNCYALHDQRPLGGLAAGVGRVPGWGESSVDELVETLERAFADRVEARRRGLAGARKLAGMTWAKTAAEMKNIVLSAN